MTNQDLQELKKAYCELGKALDKQFEIIQSGITPQQIELVRETCHSISRARDEIALITDMTMEEIIGLKSYCAIHCDMEDA